VTHSLLRSLIRETLLTEEVYGAQATVYHGTNADPLDLVSALLNDKFKPGKGAGSMYGKGLYTVYDLNESQTEQGNYGDHIIKLKLNLYGYIIFDPDVALKVYKAPLSIVEQAQEVGLDEDLVKKLRSVKIDPYNFTSVAANFASKFLKGRVKGIVYTGSNDGRCAVVYDPTTAVPIAWKKVRSKSWTPVDRSSIKPALRRSASGDWEEEKYETDSFKVLARLEKLPVDQRIVKRNLELDGRITSLPAGLRVEGSLSVGESRIASLPRGLQVLGDLDFSNSSIESIPADIQVGGTLDLSYTRITSLPAGFRVGGGLSLTGTRIASLPPGLRVGGNLDLKHAPITSLPEDLQVGGGLRLSSTPITSLPADLRVDGYLDLARTPITSLPAGLRVGGVLSLYGTPITSLPADMDVGGDLILAATSITSLPAGLKVGGELFLHASPVRSLPADLKVEKSISGFAGNRSLVPAHLRSKIK
jgi:hypothetical protein